MSRPRKLTDAEEAALVIMKRADDAADKEIMQRFNIGRQTIYDIMARVSVQDSRDSVQHGNSPVSHSGPLMGSTAA